MRKVSSSAVAKTTKRYDETSSHEDRHRKGRPRVTSAAEDKFIRVTSLSSSNRHISTSIVQRRLCKSGLRGQIAAKKPLPRTPIIIRDLLGPRNMSNGH